jgi:hypothetical protein
MRTPEIHMEILTDGGGLAIVVQFVPFRLHRVEEVGDDFFLVDGNSLEVLRENL